jgi:hypothetical protein
MWKQKIAAAIALLAVGVGGVHLAHADIIGVVGPPSSLGALPLIILAPSDALNQCITTAGQVGFDEAQGVVTPVPFSADDAVVIPAGTLVDSHMIFFNQAAVGSGASHASVVWSFRRPIIAVMSNETGDLEAASTPTLGSPATNYVLPPTAACVPFGPVGAAPYPARGLDSTLAVFPYTHNPCPGADCYDVIGGLGVGTLMTVGTQISQPGDWIRVITQGALDVAIDIKPGSDPNCFNINGAGVIPVAILGSATFDVTQIDTSTLDFAGLSVRVRGNGTPQCSISDTNGDGFNDMVCQFQDDPSAWSPGVATAELTGLLLSGVPFEGSDAICLVP